VNVQQKAEASFWRNAEVYVCSGAGVAEGDLYCLAWRLWTMESETLCEPYSPAARRIDDGG
jgi:hypothetical protein